MHASNLSDGKQRPTGQAVVQAGRETIAALIRDGRRRGRDDLAIADEILRTVADPTWVDTPQLAKAMSHPVRTRILQLLRDDGPSSPSRAAEQLEDVSLGTVSYHFRTLEGLGLIEIQSTRPRRGAIEHIYALSS